MPHPVNMREVARLAGVSIATVSKSLSNKQDVSSATREHVLAVCARLGYKTNPLVAALMRSRRQRTSPTGGLTIAYVTAFTTADGWRRHPFPIFRQLFTGAEARARERNYRLEHHWLFRDGMSNQRFSQILEARGIRGVLLAPVPDTHTSITPNWSAFSVAALGLTPSTRQFHRVSTDYCQSMLLAMDHCRQRGYRRPGLAARLETVARLEYRWEAAFGIARERLGLPDAVQPLIVDEWTKQNVDRWLRQARPDVVIGPVLGRLEELITSSGMRVPDDIGLVGLLVPKTGDRLTGVLQDGEILGATAIDQIISQMERNEIGIPDHPVTHTMLGRWNTGRTIRAPLAGG